MSPARWRSEHITNILHIHARRSTTTEAAATSNHAQILLDFCVFSNRLCINARALHTTHTHHKHILYGVYASKPDEIRPNLIWICTPSDAHVANGSIKFFAYPTQLNSTQRIPSPLLVHVCVCIFPPYLIVRRSMFYSIRSCAVREHMCADLYG